jgi:hypothetical protein
MFEALPAGERNTLLGVKGLSALPSKAQPLGCASSNEAASAVAGASADQLSERVTNPDGDENQMASRKPGRPRAAVDSGKAVEKKAAKVGLSIFFILMADRCSLLLEGERADRKKSCQSREREERQGIPRES